MQLVTCAEADLWLTEAIETDPVMMRELGGPLPKQDIPRIHARRLASIGPDSWWFKILIEPAGLVVGTIGIWRTTWQGVQISEAGWAILAEFQGRGLASEALRLLLAQVREEGRWGRGPRVSGRRERSIEWTVPQVRPPARRGGRRRLRGSSAPLQQLGARQLTGRGPIRRSGPRSSGRAGPRSRSGRRG